MNRLVCGNSGPIITNNEQQLQSGPSKFNIDLSRVTVANSIVNRLLGYSVEMVSNDRILNADRFSQMKSTSHLEPAREMSAQLRKSGRQSLSISFKRKKS